MSKITFTIDGESLHRQARADHPRGGPRQRRSTSRPSAATRGSSRPAAAASARSGSAAGYMAACTQPVAEGMVDREHGRRTSRTCARP